MRTPARAGDRLGERYKLLEPIGRGSMGQVWRGWDEHLDRPVAVKIALLPQEIADGAEAERTLKRFEREAKAAARLDHPNIAVIHDAAVGPGHVRWLVMQLVDGVTVGDVLAERGALPPDMAAATAAQLCAGLSAAHTAGLVHRDLKPENVMIRRDGLLKILDFGLVRLVGDVSRRLTVTGENVGNALYASPELLGGGPAPDARSDLYAVGCLLHHLLTGGPPFDPEPPALLPGCHLHQRPPSLADCGLDAPGDLQELITDLLAKDREHRPASAADVYRRLVPFLPPAEPAGGTDHAKALPEDPRRPFRFPSAPFTG
ncbi:serine/threonine protein kinase [Streptomyces carpaticus]|uniref:serine/threonine-protein kinase n=1 Tax=Streptomyces carpaticus TaxID=285558 RepID=UPI0021FFD0B3|nr:serine/threonine protein kinase [Streptomyces carpaticus]